MSQEKSNLLDSDMMLQLTADIVTAYVANNPVPAKGLPEIIKEVHITLDQLGGGTKEQEEAPLIPAVPIKKSITKDFIICLEDGKKLKMLKRYLRTRYDMSPEDYRARWNLPTDYPMVAPSYAARRSDFAKKIGLGKSATKRG